MVYIATTAIVVASVVGMAMLKNVGYMVDDISKSERMYVELKLFEKNVKA